MRSAVLLLIAWCLTAQAHAQPQEWADKLFAKEGTSHDFGTVARGAMLSYRFPLTNIYAVELTITNIRVSCGCVTATPSAQTFKPKQSGYIEITMDGRRFTGPKSVTIYVSVGPQYTSTATLQVSANSRGDIVFNPGQVSFGAVASGATPTQTIDVEYAGNLNWKITAIADHAAPLEAKITELYREPGAIIKVGYRLSTKLKPTALAGTHHWELLLKTNDPASPTVPVQVEATIQAPLSVLNQAKFAAATVGRPVEIKVAFRGHKPFRFVSVEGVGDGLSVELPTEKKPVQVLIFKWQPTKAGELRRVLRFKTDLDGAVINVPVEGTAQ